VQKFAAVLQIAAVLAIIGFSTWQFVQGNLAAGMSAFPLLIVYYLFVVSRVKRR
jgi:hypothetical protein